MSASDEIIKDMRKREQDGEKLKLKDFQYHGQVLFYEKWYNFKNKIKDLLRHG